MDSDQFHTPPRHAGPGRRVSGRPNDRRTRDGRAAGQAAGRGGDGGERTGAALAGEIVEHPCHDHENVQEEQNNRPRDTAPGAVGEQNPALLLDEEGEAVGRVLVGG